MNKIKLFLISCSLLLLTACTYPVPQDKPDLPNVLGNEDQATTTAPTTTAIPTKTPAPTPTLTPTLTPTPKPQCQQGKETGRSCVSCNTARVTRLNSNCTSHTNNETDYSCTNGCYQPPAQEPQQGTCCKICKTGKACGDSCINKSYNCTKPKGCACDG